MIQAMPGKVVVKVDVEPDKTASGLYIPEDARDKANAATVISSDALQPGCRVLIGKYAGVEVLHEGEKYIVLKTDEILAVIESVPVLS